MIDHTNNLCIWKGLQVDAQKLNGAFHKSYSKENDVENDNITSREVKREKERTRANLEPLNEQILNITKLLQQLTVDTLAKYLQETSYRPYIPTTGTSEETKIVQARSIFSNRKC